MTPRRGLDSAKHIGGAGKGSLTNSLLHTPFLPVALDFFGGEIGRVTSFLLHFKEFDPATEEQNL